MDTLRNGSLSIREVYRRKYAPRRENPIESSADLMGGWDEEQYRMMKKLAAERAKSLPPRRPRRETELFEKHGAE